MERKELSKIDVAVSRALHALTKDVKNFDADFIKAIETDKIIIILVNKEHVGRVIGAGGKNVKKLTETLGKKVKVIEKASEKDMIEKLLNTQILALNKVYSGKEKIRIRIEKRFEKQINKDLKLAIEKLIKKPVEIIFE